VGVSVCLSVCVVPRPGALASRPWRRIRLFATRVIENHGAQDREVLVQWHPRVPGTRDALDQDRFLNVPLLERQVQEVVQPKEEARQARVDGVLSQGAQEGTTMRSREYDERFYVHASRARIWAMRTTQGVGGTMMSISNPRALGLRPDDVGSKCDAVCDAPARDDVNDDDKSVNKY